MHYCIHVITKTFPSEDELCNILAPYDEEKLFDEEGNRNSGEAPAFSWDWYQIGGRYGGQLKLRVDKKSKTDYNWNFYENRPREGRLFHSAALNKIRQSIKGWDGQEEEWFQYMGWRDGFIRVDGAKISDIENIEDIGSFGFIDANGHSCAREVWHGDKWLDIPDYDVKYRKAIEEAKDGYITVIDIHD